MGARFPVITQAWRNAWEYVTPFLAFPPEVRRVDLHDECDRGAQPAAAQRWHVQGLLSSSADSSRRCSDLGA